MSECTCPFCMEFEHGIGLPYDEIGVDSRVLGETNNFVVVADISPLRPGHCLILPREHLISFGQVKTHEHRLELERVLSALCEVLSELFEPPTVMEHGSSSSMDGGACISHAHLQVIPGSFNTLPYLAPYQLSDIDSIWDLERWAVRDEPYVLASQPDGDMYVATGVHGIAKQFIRRLFASELGLEEPLWNWRALVLSDNLRATVTALAGLQDKL